MVCASHFPGCLPPCTPLTVSDMAALGSGTAFGKLNNSSNNGASDASPDGTPSQFLLLRSLEPTVTEELLAKGVAKLYKPSRKSSPTLSSTTKKGNAKVASTTGDANLGAREGSLRRVLLIRSRKTQESWRYGFAEFATVEVCCSLSISWRYQNHVHMFLREVPSSQ